MRPLRFPLTAAFLTFLTLQAMGFPPEAKFIPAREYATTVQQEMEKSKSSITVCLYLFTLRPQQHDSPVLKLAETLRKAHQAGIQVEVILDQNINFVEEDGPDTDRTEGKNAAAYANLKTQGIPVFFDDVFTIPGRWKPPLRN